MEIGNAKIETLREGPSTRNYPADENDVKYYVVLSFDIPGGKAVYKLNTDKKINDSIETASRLK